MRLVFHQRSARQVLAQVCAWLIGLSVAGACAQNATPSAPTWTHAHAAFGQPKYPPGFAHFNYVDPNAPKGGTINLRNPDRRSSFDKFNPFTVKGNAPAGMSIFMFESLAVLGSDELQTMYGLLAEAIAVAPDKSSISFRLNPKARFNNGDPVTAEDVRYSFESMSGKYAAPGLRAALSSDNCVACNP